MNNWSKFSTSFVIGLTMAGWFLQNHRDLQPSLHGDQSHSIKKTSLQDSGLGITNAKPTAEPFVELPDGRFMVPYTTTIPGTDVEYTMIPIRGGNFLMGSPESEEDRRDDEGPQFEVAVAPFWMGKYEVTWAEYKKYMQLEKAFKALQSKGLRNVVADEIPIDGITAPSSLYDPSFTFEAGEEPDQPAATMTQYAAKQYTKWLSRTSDTFYRLPTEAEWEYACRAGTTTAFYFGDDPDELEEHGWFIENSDEERHTVGELKPNPWGLYDMYGNVAEWVLDQYDEAGYTHVTKPSVDTAAAYNRPTKVYPRVLRGGSWELEPEECRSAARLGSDDREWRSEDPNFPKSPWWYTDTPGLGTGFRLLRPLEEPASREEMEAFWKADLDEILDDARNRISENGRGAYGTVDPKLPGEIQELTDDDR